MGALKMSDTLKSSILPETASALLIEMGYRGKITSSGDRPIIESATNGGRFYVNFFERNEIAPETGFCAIQFSTGFNLNSDCNPSELIQLCNAFNRRYRNVKVVIGGNSPKYVELQLDADVYGEAKQWFEYYAEFFLIAARAFFEEICETNEFRGDGCTEIHCNAVQLAHGINRDAKAAIELYRKAAYRGYAGSQNNLGDQYERGEALPKSDLFGVYWYTRAAERGEPTAYLSLSTLLSEQAADREMLIEALKFGLLAIERLPKGYNHQTAQKCVERLFGLLTDEEVATARERISVWKPLFQESRLMSDTPDGNRQLDAPSKSLH